MLMRGYRLIERTQGFSKVRALKNDLTQAVLADAKSDAAFFFGASSPSAELVVRQFAFDRYGGSPLTRALYQSLGSSGAMRIAMPGTWRDRLEAYGWKVNRFAAAAGWYFVAVGRLAHGVLHIVRLASSLWQGGGGGGPVLAPHVVFESLAPANLPVLNRSFRSYEICSFYAQWSGRPAAVKAICHNIPGIPERRAGDLPVSYRPPIYLLATGRANAFRLAAWGAAATAFAALQLCLGRWGYALMLAEAAKAYCVRLCPPERLASEYLFHSSGTIYRPMWTYEAQRLGAEISLYFYSTYDQPKLKRGYECQLFEWGPANWPRYVVWDADQARNLEQDLGGGLHVAYSGGLSFSDNEQHLPPLPAHAVAVFDIQPHRRAAHFGMSTLADCLAAHPDYYHRFLADVSAALGERGAQMVLKGKRDIGSRGDRQYQRMLDRLSGAGNMTVIAPEISAIRVVDACCAGISVPFTSAAIYLRDRGKPSAYYDPYGWMQPDDRGARDIPLIQGREQLQEWLDKVLPRTSVATRQGLPC